MFGSSESWGPQQHPHPWHFRAGGGAVHSIRSGRCLLDRCERLCALLLSPACARGLRLSQKRASRTRPRLVRCLQPSQPASTHAEFEAGVAAPSVSARAFPDLRDGCRGRTRQGHAVAAALHVAERALRTFHRGYERRCRGWRQHNKHDEGGEGGDRAHGPSSVAHFTYQPWRGAVPLRANVRLASDSDIRRWLLNVRCAPKADVAERVMSTRPWSRLTAQKNIASPEQRLSACAAAVEESAAACNRDRGSCVCVRHICDPITTYCRNPFRTV